jgi:3-oxoacyl-(acyl-carrier-protein) synthase
MESRAHARGRGAKALVEVAGYGTCGDAYHPTAPHPEGLGLEQAVRRALDRVAPAEIGFINAHGTATTANDQVEGSTFARIFGQQVTVFGSKGYTGHTLGAAGAIEAIFIAQGLLSGEIPATAGFSEPDPGCAIVPTRSLTKVRGDYALSTSLAFGGNNSALLLKRGQ